MVDEPYRLVAGATDVALGTVAKCMKDLAVRGILREQLGRRTIADRPALVALWVQAYIEALRPGLQERRFQVRADDKPQLWARLQAVLAKREQRWALTGADAAARRDGFFRAEDTEVYAPVGVLDDRGVQKALVAQPAVRGGNLLVIEPPGPLAIPDAVDETIPATPDLLAYAELRYRGTAYSHMRRAQPIRLAHHLLAYFWMLQRDRDRLASARSRTALSGTGAGACAGTGIALDRAFIAEQLGFDGVTQNSLDTVSDRDFILEFLAAATICGGHLSRLAADLCLWSGPEFDFARLDMAYCTGSSMMPQKVNPDTMELARAKVATLNAELATLAGLLHGLPLGYQRDLQDDKRPLLNGATVLIDTLDIVAAVIATTDFKADNMAAAAEDPGLLAADWAEELVAAGVPFRAPYGVIGRLMKQAAEAGVDPRAMDEAALADLHEHLPATVAAVPDADAAIERKATDGSPAKVPLAEQMAAAEALLAG